VNRRQKKRRQERRAHDMRTRTPDRPPVVLARDSFPDVKSAHIVPRVYQRSWAIDGQVAVHIDGNPDCVTMPIRRAGTRSRYYQRTRPSGEKVDDIEASLAYVEDKVTAPLTDLIQAEPITFERKGAVAQLLGVQILRGPAFFEQREELLRPIIDALQPADFKPEALTAAGGDPVVARRQLASTYLGSTWRFMTMLQRSMKMATLLAHMRWQIVRFDDPELVYSDHPVVVWPLDIARSAPLERQGFAPLGALEIRVPISPRAAIVMTWSDKSDDGNVPLSSSAAVELNAFTVAQADRQWMHQPGAEPSVGTGIFAPISRLKDPSYNRAAAMASRRRATAEAFLHRTKNRRYVRDVEIIVEVEASLG
jgi:hypothetical protein